MTQEQDKEEIEFTDRYKATGIPYPTKDSCCECEGMGLYPVQKKNLNNEACKSPTGRLLIIGQKDVEEDDWVFVQCPFCNGTRKKKDIDIDLGEKDPTPSDTFIEEKIEEIRIIIRDNLIWYKDNGEDHGDLVLAEETIKEKVKSSLQEQRQSILEEIEKVIISFDDKKEEIIKGQRFLIDDKEKLPFGYPYPDTKEKYIISKIKPNKAIK